VSSVSKTLKVLGGAMEPDRQGEFKPLAVGRRTLSRGLFTMLIACGVLFLASALFASSSVTKGPLLSMLPYASILAVVALGQTLVIQQGGIDLSVQGGVSLGIVICTHIPAGRDSKLLGAVLLALGVAVVAGLVNGMLIGWLRLNAIVATLGTNALLYAIVLAVSGGTPRFSTDRLARIGGGLSFGIPNSVYFAAAITIVTAVAVKWSVAGRRFEAVGANPLAATTSGLRSTRHRVAAYVWAQVLYCLGAMMFAGVVTQPTAFQGNSYLLPSVAAVVLGGTSLLGGRGNLVATVVAALFLEQLGSFVLALGRGFAFRTLVQAAALAIGVALYTVDWKGIRRRLARPDHRPAIAT
jgi:ribose transport system permease protein